MDELEKKVLKGLECCSNGDMCHGHCPYDVPGNNIMGCTSQLARDAHALILKQQKTIREFESECKDCGKKTQTVFCNLRNEIESLRLKPRVLTLDEVKKLPEESDMFLELSKAVGDETFVTSFTVFGVGTGGIATYGLSLDYKDYQKIPYGWVLWTARPTEEQRRTVQWINREN